LLLATSAASTDQAVFSNQSTLEKTDRSAVQSKEFILDQSCGLVGDLNQDGKVVLSDVILYVNAIFHDNSIIGNLAVKCVIDTNSDGMLLTLAGQAYFLRDPFAPRDLLRLANRLFISDSAVPYTSWRGMKTLQGEPLRMNPAYDKRRRT